MPNMRRFFGRKFPGDGATKDDESGRRPKKSLFGKSPTTAGGSGRGDGEGHAEDSNLSHSQTGSTSSASSTISIPVGPLIITPSDSASSVTSTTSGNESASSGHPSIASDVTSISTSPSLKRSAGSSASITSEYTAAASPAFLCPPPAQRARPATSPETSSPLSIVVDPTSIPTPPPSPGNDSSETPRRRPLYKIFRKSHSQPNLSGSNSTTSFSSSSTDPQGHRSGSKRTAGGLLRRMTSHRSVEDDIGSSKAVGEGGLFSRNEVEAHRAILQGDPLGSGPYLYPSKTRPVSLAPESHLSSTRPMHSRGNRRSRGYEGGRRASWGVGGPPGGAAWRAPQFAGSYGTRMTIEEENIADQPTISSVQYVEDAPEFAAEGGQRGIQQRRPLSNPPMRTGCPLSEAHPTRAARLPPFAPPPLLPPMDQFLAVSSDGPPSPRSFQGYFAPGPSRSSSGAGSSTRSLR